MPATVIETALQQIAETLAAALPTHTVERGRDAPVDPDECPVLIIRRGAVTGSNPRNALRSVAVRLPVELVFFAAGATHETDTDAAHATALAALQAHAVLGPALLDDFSTASDSETAEDQIGRLIVTHELILSARRGDLTTPI